MVWDHIARVHPARSNWPANFNRRAKPCKTNAMQFLSVAFVLTFLSFISFWCFFFLFLCAAAVAVVVVVASMHFKGYFNRNDGY